MFQNEKWSLPQNHTLSDKWDVIHRSLASECVYTKTRPLSILTIRFVQPKWWWQEHSSQGFKAQKPMGDITAANLLYHLLDKVKTSAKHQHYLWNLESHFYVISGILFKDQTLCNSHHLEVTELGRRCNFQILDRFWHSDSAHMLVFLMQGLIWYIICMNGGSCLLHLLLLWVQQLQFSRCPTCKIILIHNLVEEHHYQDNVKASTPSYLMPCTPFHTSIIWL